jgi:hypothetical protein
VGREDTHSILSIGFTKTTGRTYSGGREIESFLAFLLLWLNAKMDPSRRLRTKHVANTNDSSPMVQDRYEVSKRSVIASRIHHSAGSVNNSTTSGSLESSDSSTTSGTSYETEDSEALEPDLFDDEEEFEDLELMSVDTHPAMGGCVDSACGWLDRPMCLLNFGKETSLLRQSKGRTRAAAIQQIRMSEALSTAANMKLSASERRTLRLRRKGLHLVPEDNDAATTKTGDGDVSVYDKQSTIEVKSRDVKFISKKRIQPFKDRTEEVATLSQTSTVESTNRRGSVSTEEDDERRLRGSGSNPSTGPVHPSKSNQTEIASVEDIEEQERFHCEEENCQGKNDPEGSVHITNGRNVKEIVTLEGSESVKGETVQDSCQDREDRELSVTLDKVLMDSPNSTEPYRMEDSEMSKSLSKRGTSLQVPSLDLPESESIESTRQKEEPKQTEKEKSKNPSSRSERSLARKQRIMKVVQRSKSNPRKKREADVTDLTHIDHNPTATSKEGLTLSSPVKKHVIHAEEKYALPKDIEIIDVLSLDDQDSWTPENARVHDGRSRGSLKKKIERTDSLEKHQKRESKSRDPSPSLSRRFSNAKGRDPSPSENGREIKSYGSVNDADPRVTSLWNEEAAKLSNESSVGAMAKSGSKNLNVAKTADDLWAQEEQKLHTDQSDIFEDHMAREAFLGHRRGRLQAVGMESANRSRSQSRRRRLAKALEEADEVADDSIHSRRGVKSTRLARTTNVDLRPAPSPENAVPIKITHSMSRDASGKSRAPSPQVIQQKQMRTQSTTELQHPDNQSMAYPTGLKKNRDLVVVRTIDDGQRLRISRSSGRDKGTQDANSYQRTMNKQPIDVHDCAEESDGARRKSGRSSHRSLERQNSTPRHQSSSREIEIVDLADVEDMMMDHRPPLPGRDARDDRESKQGTRSLRRGSSGSPPAEDWPDYETVISATRELRKLEKKIEKQLRQVKRETKSQEWESQAVSSKEIRKLEKQLAQKLKRENEKRGTKLKRIRRKVLKTSSAVTAGEDPIKPKVASIVSTASGSQQQQQLEPQHDDVEPEYLSEKQQPHPMPDDMNDASTLGKSFSQKVDDFREKSKFDEMRVLRSSRFQRNSSPHGTRSSGTPIEGNY